MPIRPDPRQEANLRELVDLPCLDAREAAPPALHVRGGDVQRAAGGAPGQDAAVPLLLEGDGLLVREEVDEGAALEPLVQEVVRQVEVVPEPVDAHLLQEGLLGVVLRHAAHHHGCGVRRDHWRFCGDGPILQPRVSRLQCSEIWTRPHGRLLLAGCLVTMPLLQRLLLAGGIGRIRDALIWECPLRVRRVLLRDGALLVVSHILPAAGLHQQHRQLLHVLLALHLLCLTGERLVDKLAIMACDACNISWYNEELAATPTKVGGWPDTVASKTNSWRGRW
mmetsp:Transcript_120781/g.352796  ORF Transcript_120781/g.352796 Transcript_120781/m.352796 type:complete len:280 (-) Transcript_120781:319-1158(-)